MQSVNTFLHIVDIVIRLVVALIDCAHFVAGLGDFGQRAVLEIFRQRLGKVRKGLMPVAMRAVQGLANLRLDRRKHSLHLERKNE